jgi:DNA ligase D-like protein (predicted ligase)
MLARLGGPFDSKSHLFEIKWDGIRALTFAQDSSYRLLTRNRNEISEKYPELAALSGLPDGTVLDGELVVLEDDRPSFHKILRREQARGETTIARLTRTLPVLYVVFDLLYRGFQSMMDQPLAERREALEEVIQGMADPRLILSQGVIGDGKSFFQQASERELEGIVAKKLSSAYLPGKRTEAWIKIKRRLTIHCVVIGFIEKEGQDFQSLLVATNELPGEDGPGELRYVGRVGTGIDQSMRHRLNKRLWNSLVDHPLVDCPETACWVEPGIYCAVSFNELTDAGVLRAPVLEQLIEG